MVLKFSASEVLKNCSTLKLIFANKATVGTGVGTNVGEGRKVGVKVGFFDGLCVGATKTVGARVANVDGADDGVVVGS